MSHVLARFAPSAVLTRLLALAALCIALSGCGILPKQERLSLHRPEPTIPGDRNWPTVPWQLQISRPYADAAHDTAHILVRPQPGELQVYKGAVWSQSAPDLVQDILIRAFTDSGRFGGVARRGEGVRAQYELLIDLRQFESDFVGVDKPHARIEFGARLVHNADNRIVSTRAFGADVVADGSDPASINRAFEVGLSSVVSQMIAWTLDEGRRDDGRR